MLVDAMAANAVDKSTGRWLWTVGKFRPVVAVCDNDAAGLKLSKYTTSRIIVEGEKDLGDASDVYVTNLLKEYT
jgi:hypothetical protein